MKRVTHITTGAAVALPVAVVLSPAAAAGAIFLGMAGAVVPDYADLKSDFRRVLRHRGVSHSLLFAGGAILLVYVIMTALTQVADPRFQLHRELVAPLCCSHSGSASAPIWCSMPPRRAASAPFFRFGDSACGSCHPACAS